MPRPRTRTANTIPPILLSMNNPANAANIFRRFLITEQYSLIVVFETGEIPDQIVEVASTYVNDPNERYRSVRVILAERPDYILNEIRMLTNISHNYPTFNWSRLQDVAYIGITNDWNKIADIVLKSDIIQNRPYLSRIVGASIVITLGSNNR